MFEDELKQNRKKRYTITYIGSNTGAFVKHPGSYQNCDSDYDPRIRTWYVDGSTGIKNNLIFFNIRDANVDGRMKEIGEYLINITNSGDWISVVDLNNCQNTTNCQIIRKGTILNKNSIFEKINSFSITNEGWKSADYTNM